MNERTVDVGGLELAVAEAGEGGEPLLLVHGFTGAKEDFTDFLDRFAAEGWHAVTFDNRGHGRSGKPASVDAYMLGAFADDVLGVADEVFGAGVPFALLGHSMGGAIAQLVATRSPARLTRLVLMDTVHGPIHGIDPEMVEAGIAVVRARGMQGMIDVYAEREGPLTTPADRRVRAERPGYVEFGERKMRDSSPDMYEAVARQLVHSDDRLEALSYLALPALVVVGEQDEPFLADSERMAKAIAGAELAVIADAGHSPQFENPEAWWIVVSGFLAGGR
jgi:pimeloyl-ACP methyl ester carboxylesterase